MSFKINKNLIWDYDLNPEDFDKESVKKWYIARVLIRGDKKDLKNIGYRMIYEYLPTLTLPYQIRKFWEWYFNIEPIRREYENIDRKPGPDNQHHIPSPFVKG